MKITDALKNYRHKKAEIEANMALIQHLKEVLKSGNLYLLTYTRRSRDIGMPRSNKIISPVEVEVIANNDESSLTKKQVQEWIDDEHDRLWLTRLEVSQIEAAIRALTRQEKYIVEWKYMDGLNWSQIELSYMETFREALTEITLKRYCASACNKINRVLKPFYDKFDFIR